MLAAAPLFLASGDPVLPQAPAKSAPKNALHRVLSGKIELQRETRIEADTILLDAATILTNGHHLTLVAQSIELKGQSYVRSFADPAGPAQSGRDAGQVSVWSSRVTGESLLISNVGQDGGQGTTGAAGQPGSAGRKAESIRLLGGAGPCMGIRPGEPGGRGGDGGPGGTGGNGGKGGLVVVSVRSGSDLIRVDIKGGRPGPGGPGGLPGAGGQGGPGEACSPPGWNGPPGKEGVSGPPGKEGQRGIAEYRLPGQSGQGAAR